MSFLTDVRRTALLACITGTLSFVGADWSAVRNWPNLPLWAIAMVLAAVLVGAITPVFYFALYRNESPLTFPTGLRKLSLRATVHMTGVAKNTVAKLLIELGTACSDYLDKALVNLPCQRVQCDEIWSFLGAKQANVTPKMAERNPYAGDLWTWVAMDPDTKLVWLHEEAEDYNFVRIHSTLRVSPAMAAGVADRLWSIQDILCLLESDQS